MERIHIEECFVCGRNNPRGLQADFAVCDGQVKGEFIPCKHHQGPRNLLHGGIVCALLDEAMATLINKTFGTDAPTASLEVRFKKPARLNERLFIWAKMINHNRRIKYVQAAVQKEDGTIIAIGKGKFLNDFKVK